MSRNTRELIWLIVMSAVILAEFFGMIALCVLVQKNTFAALGVMFGGLFVILATGGLFVALMERDYY